MEIKNNQSPAYCGPCSISKRFDGCVDGVPYAYDVCVANGQITNAYTNLETGEVALTKPENFVLGTCDAPVTTPCTGSYFQKDLALTAGVAVTLTHDFDLTEFRAIGYSVIGVDGATPGDWPTGVRFINHTATTVDIIADGLDGVVDLTLWNHECLETIIPGSPGSGDAQVVAGLQAQINILAAKVTALEA
jgi:hypothetical protein